MPEYLAPGVFVEEVSYRSKAIEGVPTGLGAFVLGIFLSVGRLLSRRTGRADGGTLRLD